MQTSGQQLGLVTGFILMAIPKATIHSPECLLNDKRKEDIILTSIYYFQYVKICHG